MSTRGQIVMRMFRLGWALPAVSSLAIACSAVQLAGPAIAAPTGIQFKKSAVSPPAAPPAPQANPARRLSQLKAQLEYGDRVIAMRSLHLALTQVPDGGTFVWRKKSRSLKGVIRPSKPFRNNSGQICRHVIYALALGPYNKQIEGIACRQNDGRWQL